jgi:hypothetical protein
MTAQTDTSRRDDLIARNLAAVETHFHNETPETIDQAIAVYTDDIVWEVPARGLVLRSIEDVKQEYLKIFGSMNYPQDRQPAPVRHRRMGVRRQHLRMDHHRGRVPQLPVPARDHRECPPAARVPVPGREDLPGTRLRDLARHQ